jgi:uncharacterized membrane protein (Fun14 family)
LTQKGVIIINYLAFEEWVKSLIGKTNALQGFLTTLITQTPIGLGFGGGLLISLKKG